MRRIELKRAFGSKGFYFGVAAGLLLAITHFFMYAVPQMSQMDVILNMNKPYLMIYSCYQMWIGADAYNLQSFLLASLLPVLAALPYGASYFEDVKGGYIKNVYIRSKRRDYLTAKYAAAFLSGGVVASFPLVVSFLLSSAAFPMLVPQQSTLAFPIGQSSMMGELFYTHPLCYVVIYIMIDFIYGGLFAVLALVFSFFTEHRYIVVTFPFILHLFIYSASNLLGNISSSGVYFLQPGFGSSLSIYVFGEMIFLFVITAGVYFWKGTKDDIF